MYGRGAKTEKAAEMERVQPVSEKGEALGGKCTDEKKEEQGQDGTSRPAV